MNEQKSQVLKRLLNYCDKKGYDLQYYGGVSEPGYDDKIMLAANWNPPHMAKIAEFVEQFFAGEVEIEWSDEWTMCDDCYKAVRTSPSSYDWEPYFLIGDGYLICGDCAKDNMEDILQEYINKKRAIPSWSIDAVKAIGFKCPGNYCQRFETGWYPGQNDTPDQALEKLFEHVGKEWFEQTFDYLFCITKRSQFYTNWTVLIRDKENQ